jgi:NADPH-dependent glutamate synthase beta subunit-like oxidoreductase
MADAAGAFAAGHVVAVIGAGPAGLFAARALGAQGCRVLLLNRDVKPGGLAEYGIFLNKYKMKSGLRRQFQRILTDPRVTYLGNVTVSDRGDLTLGDLRGFGFDALVFAIGAQGITPRTSSTTTTGCRPSASSPSPWAGAWPSWVWAMSWWTSRTTASTSATATR